MKLRSTTLAIVLIVLIVQPVSGGPCSTRIGSSIESIVPREGLQFYVEISSTGLRELADAGSATAIFGKLFTGPLKVTPGNLTAFMMGNAAALSSSRLAIVGYADNQTGVIIEAASEADAARLSAAIAKLFVSKGPSGKAATGALDLSVRGRLIAAGSQALVGRLAEDNGGRTLADDQEFAKSRSRFAEEPLFAFVDLNARSLGLPGADRPAIAQTPAVLAALGGMPYALALGGSLHGDSATVRALLLNGSGHGAGGAAGVFGGLLTSVTSSAILGQPRAASFASSSADLFVDLMIDWNKLVDSLQAIFGMFAGAVAAGTGDAQSSVQLQPQGIQNADFLGMLEASLGFSIKHDLIPTLGNEVAISLSGLSNHSTQFGGDQTATRAPKKGSPRFMLMVAVRDEAKFEKLLGKLIHGPKGSAQPLTQSLYRGASIKSGNMAYTITGGFLFAGGSVAEIRRALDANAMGNALDSTAEFRQAFAGSRPASLQAYLSPRLSKELLDSLARDAARAGGISQQATMSAQTPPPIGLSVIPDDDGLMIEAHLPTSLLAAGLAAMFNAKPAPYGISSQPGSEAPNTTRPGAPGTPRLTDDDLRFRRP